MPKARLVTDFSSFKHGVIAAVVIMDQSSKTGMKKAVIRFMKDALDKQPKVPRDTGALEASHSVFVGSKLIATSADRAVSGDGEATPQTSLAALSTKLQGALIASKQYAASLHEGISRWGTLYTYSGSGRGRKWIESKMLRYFDEYYMIIAGDLRRAK